MPQPKDLVYQQSNSSGTGNLTLTAVNGKQSFASAFGTGTTLNVFDYFISSRGFSQWEIGTGHMSDATTLVRDTIVASSNSNLAVNFTSGAILDVTNDIPSQYQVRTSTTSVTDGHIPLFDGTSGSLIKSSGSILGTLASLNSPLAVANGGTGATLAATGLSNLGGQPLNSTLTSLGGLSLSSGDTLYASAASTLQRLAKGSDGNVLKLVSGLPAWGNSFTVSLFATASSTQYNAPSGLLGALVIITGGGAGGAGVSTLGSAGKGVAGGGGGAGATAISFLTGAQIGTSQTITIGSGGLGGAAGNTSGNDGVSSSFGSLLIAGKGFSGLGVTVTAATSAGYYGLGGAGGTATAGQLLLTGGKGSDGVTTYITSASYGTAQGGCGGGSFWGGNSGSATIKGTNKDGYPGNTYGAGGGGAAAYVTSTANVSSAGGNGIGGVCVIFEFKAA